MVSPLHCHCQATATILLFVLPAVSSLVPTLSIQQIQAARNINARKIARADAARKTTTQLSLGVDPTDIVAQNAHLLHDLHHHATAVATNDPTSTLDFLSSFTLAKASVVPNQSVAPLADTIKSTLESNPNNLLETIPDMPSMPGGAPRSGNAFLAESFRELYDGTLKTNPQTSWTNNGVLYQGDGASNALVVPAREWDVVARYADLLNRIPLAATVYALVDFFLINAEEDLAIAELLDEEAEVEAIMDVENKVLAQRVMGLLLVVVATVTWSLLTYHPVPFNEL